MRIRAYSLIGLGAALLAACSVAPPVAPIDIAAREAEAATAFERGELDLARSRYADLAARTEGSQRRRFQLDLARVEVALGNADAAMGVLDSVAALPDGRFDPAASAVRADALFALGRTVEAVELLVEREIWLETPAEISANQQAIWEGLRLPFSLITADTRTGDPTIDGWLALAPLTRMSSEDSELLDALIGWRDEFPNHPATGGVLSEMLAGSRLEGVRPARIALLLPLTSARRAEALAVRDGFFAAHLASGFAADSSIQVYDTAQRGSIESFLTAQLEGADFIVGPLLPDEVARVQAEAGFVPTLALNLGAADAARASNFFQFALSSDDEIEAIADRAIANGHETAVALFASDDRGYRIMNRFRDAFESRGGRVINSVAYVSGSANLTAPIEELLNISQSEARYDRLRANLGLQLEFEPRRRADIDMVFLQAGPVVGRLLVPLLRDNDADPDVVATYATSEIYDPIRRGNEADLDGLIFTDLPLLVGTDSGAQSAASMLGEFSTASANQLRRLFAFGYDAYQLIAPLSADNGTAWRISGATGELSVDPRGRIRRALPFAEFRGGRPVALVPDSTGPFSAR
ncbi:MAG: penicillin-binding protein activator [Gammaproteobacteria bacterium]|jgi:outer membrane PBP1 activator LpoA protein